VRVAVPNAARPAPPVPLYVVPTFGWSASTDSGGVQSVRHGGGLRVYLDRPWWSSGEGELLGVVVWPAPVAATDIDPPLKPYVTAWGRDPLYLSAPVPHAIPRLDDFTRATVKQATARLAERDATVAVAGHPVQADVDRRLWYCDIELTPGKSHLPFVRLALARFQPNSLPGVELSHIVLADFVQLAPDRSASVTFTSDPNRAIVGVTGNSYAHSADGKTFGRVEVTVETRDPAIPGELGWQEAGAPQVLIPMALSTGSTQWSGTVTLSAPRGHAVQRLVVREYDNLPGGARLTYTDVLAI
jgi:hypothetical protein